MAVDTKLILLKEARKLLKSEVDHYEVFKRLDELLGDNIKEAVLDTELVVRKQDLLVVKRELAETEKLAEETKIAWDKEIKEGEDRVKTALAEKQQELEAGLVDLRVRAENEKVDLQKVIRSDEQKGC